MELTGENIVDCLGFFLYFVRYCLDKNYGGWLSIWDRIFGTFQEEIPEEDIVYGLVDQPRFFDVIKHQLFYFEILQEKVLILEVIL